MTSNDNTNLEPCVGTPETKRQKAFVDAITMRDEFVRSYIYSRTRNNDLSRELAHKTWIAVYRTFKEENFTSLGLLKCKAFQTLVSHMRAAQTRSFVAFTDDLEGIAPAYIDREEEGAQSEAAFEERFWERFLPVVFDPVDRKMFMLMERYGYSGAEIAVKVGLPLSSVHHRIEALKRAAKEQLEKDI